MKKAISIAAALMILVTSAVSFADSIALRDGVCFGDDKATIASKETWIQAEGNYYGMIDKYDAVCRYDYATPAGEKMVSVTYGIESSTLALSAPVYPDTAYGIDHALSKNEASKIFKAVQKNLTNEYGKPENIKVKKVATWSPASAWFRTLQDIMQQSLDLAKMLKNKYNITIPNYSKWTQKDANGILNVELIMVCLTDYTGQKSYSVILSYSSPT